VWLARKKAPSLEFRSADSRFGVYLPPRTVALMLRLCRRAGTLETGGILAGRYSPDLLCALINAVSGAPADSKRGPAFFERGGRNLQAWLDRRWAKHGEHYLGEWHYHPMSSSTPSSTDRHQLRLIAEGTRGGCPEPILLVLGGNPSRTWSMSAHVFPRGREDVELRRVTTAPR